MEIKKIIRKLLSGSSYDTHYDHEIFNPGFENSRKLRSPYPMDAHMMDEDMHATLNLIQKELLTMREENFNLSKKLMREKFKAKIVGKNQDKHQEKHRHQKHHDSERSL